MSAGRWAAAAMVAATILANVGTVWVYFETDFASRIRGPGVSDLDVLILNTLLFEFAGVTFSYVFVGFLLAGRPGAGRIATVLLAGGAVFAATPFGYIVGEELAFQAPESAFANAVFLLGPVAVGPGYALILPGLALVFPTGRLPSRRWRLPVALVVGALAAGSAIEVILPGSIAATPGSHNPFGIDALPAGLSAAVDALVAIGVAGIMVLGVAAVVTRHRSGDATLQRQLRWFIAAVMLAALPLCISILPAIGGPQWGAVAAIALVLVPVSVAIAVTRHRLYEIDRLISRTIGWALVTGVLVAVFAGTLVGLQAILTSVTRAETPAVAASTLLVFALFQPLRRRVQAAVDRRFDRAHYNGEQTLAAFAERLREDVDLASLEADIAGTVASALRPTSTGIWIRESVRNASHAPAP